MLLLFRGLSYFRMFCSVAQAEKTALNFRYKIRPHKNSYAKLLQEIFECSYIQAYNIFKKNSFLHGLDLMRIKNAAKVLRKVQISVEEIREYPRVLSIFPNTIEHHFLLLKESGFPKVSPRQVVYYRPIVIRKISLLKAHGLLPKDANVSRNFLTALEAPENVSQTVESVIDVDSDENNIAFLRDTVLKCYLQWRLGASKEEIEYIFSTYARVLHKSLQLIRRTLSILLNELHFPKEHITRHGYIIQAHPESLKRIVKTVPYFAGKPMRDVLFDHPPMAICRFENFIEIVSVLRRVGISEENIINNQNLFSLSGQCVRNRLPSLDPKHISPEMKAFMTDDKLIRILLHYKNFDQRVAFLSNQSQRSSLHQVPSLNFLLGSQKIFERFIKGVGGHPQGHDVVNYLVSSFRGLENDITSARIRALLWKNPNWRNVPLSEVRACLEMLCKKGYKKKEIFLTIPILLYPSNIVEDHLKNLSSQPEISECFQLDGVLGSDNGVKGDYKSDAKDRKHNFISKNKREALIRKYALQLCLYFLERNYHFSGDGIWFRP